MATKKQQLDAKLGSWTDQANLTRAQTEPPLAETSPSSGPATPVRTAYPVERGLVDRIHEAAERSALSRNQVVGHLLTWALDQVESGAYQLPGNPQ